MKKQFLLIVLTNLVAITLLAQTKPRFWDDVQTIKSYDKIYRPPLRPILFTGSSSIRLWANAQQTFPQYTILNRGVGGTVLNDINFYAEDLIFPYNPKQIVLYVGENDITNETNTADTILHRTIRLVKQIRERLPDVPIVYISIKASPSREKYIQKVIDANQLIKAFLATEAKMVYVDIFYPMLDKGGKIRGELFLADRLHMTPAGYAIWAKELRKHLIKGD